MPPEQALDFVLQTFGCEVKGDETMERLRTFVPDKVAMVSGYGPPRRIQTAASTPQTTPQD